MRLDEREAHKGSVARNIIFLGGIHFLKHYALAVDDLNIARPLSKLCSRTGIYKYDSYKSDQNITDEGAIKDFYCEIFEESIKNDPIILSNHSARDPLRVFCGIVAILLIALTFPVSIPLVYYIYLETHRSPLDLFNTSFEQISKELDIIKKDLLPAFFAKKDNAQPNP